MTSCSRDVVSPIAAAPGWQAGHHVRKDAPRRPVFVPPHTLFFDTVAPGLLKGRICSQILITALRNSQGKFVSGISRPGLVRGPGFPRIGGRDTGKGKHSSVHRLREISLDTRVGQG